MAIEVATYINSLNVANPPTTDPLGEADDHIRLLKSVLKTTFPNITGAMTVTDAILNGLDGRATANAAAIAAIGTAGNSVALVSANLEVTSQFRADATAAYAFVVADRNRLLTRTNAAAMADTIPIASTLGAGWACEVENIHATSLLTITPTTSTINGAATLVVYPGQRYKINGDGANYRAIVSGNNITRYAAKTDNYTVLPANTRPATIFDFTTAGFTLSTAVAASSFSGAFWVKNSAASGQVTWDPNGAETTDGAATLVIDPGDSYCIAPDGSNWKIAASHVATKASPSAVGLIVQNNASTPDTQVTVAADFAILVDTLGRSVFHQNVSQNTNLATTGVSALDTGALAVSTWYNIFLISNGVSCVTLASLSATAPTMPSGYTYKMRVGAVRYSSTSQLLRVVQKGSRAVYNIQAAGSTTIWPVIAAGAIGNPGTPTYVSTSISTFVPPTASSLSFITSSTNSSVACLVSTNGNHGTAGSATKPPNYGRSSDVNTAPLGHADIQHEGTTIFVAQSGSTTNLFCSGWIDKVNAS